MTAVTKAIGECDGDTPERCIGSPPAVGKVVTDTTAPCGARGVAPSPTKRIRGECIKGEGGRGGRPAAPGSHNNIFFRVQTAQRIAAGQADGPRSRGSTRRIRSRTGNTGEEHDGPELAMSHLMHVGSNAKLDCAPLHTVSDGGCRRHSSWFVGQRDRSDCPWPLPCRPDAGQAAPPSPLFGHARGTHRSRAESRCPFARHSVEDGLEWLRETRGNEDEQRVGEKGERDPKKAPTGGPPPQRNFPFETAVLRDERLAQT